jgi:hypothetical protein
MLLRTLTLAPLLPLAAALRGSGDAKLAGEAAVAPKRVAIIGTSAVLFAQILDVTSLY